MKICCTCKLLKNLSDFGNNQCQKDGLQRYCKECAKISNKKVSNQRKKEYARVNRSKSNFKEIRKQWYNSNSYKWTEYAREKRKNNEIFRLLTNLRGRLWHALNGTNKSQSTIQLLGCSIDELRIHLESKFTEGMSWKNYGRGGWEVDHIKPCASFDLTDPEQQKQCFHYTNLQPLWKSENRKKSNKVFVKKDL